MDLSNPENWRKVKAGDVVLLSDQQALQDSVKAGLGLKPLQYTISEVTRILEMHDSGTWILYRLKPSAVQQELVLMCKIVDSEMDLRLYYETDFESGSRTDIISRGDLFLFQPPADADNFKASALKFSLDLSKDSDRWVIKPFGELHGEAVFSPAKSGINGTVATIAEYTLKEGQSLDTEVLLLEIGKGPEGLVRMFAGCTVNLNEIEVFPI